MMNGTSVANKNKIHSPNGIIYNKIDIANVFADHFENVHNLTRDMGNSKLNNKIKIKYREISHLRSAPNQNRTYIHSVEIKSIIAKLKNKKAPGMDGITNLQIKNVPNKIIVQLIHIFNQCFNINYFPVTWKLAKILPVPKPNKN